MIEVLFTWLLITTVTIALYIEWERRKISKLVKHIPGPPEIPGVGSMFAIRPKTNNEMGALFDDVAFAPVTKVFIGTKLIVIISEPKAMYQFFTSRVCLERPFILKFLKLDGGLITTKYKLWKPLRKEVNCFFNQRAALFTIPTFIQHYKRLCDRIDEIKDNGPFNLRREMMQRNIALILETTMNITDMDPRLRSEIMETVDDCVIKRCINPLHYPEFIYRMTEDYQIDTKNRGIFFDVFDMYIRQKEKEIKPESYNGTGPEGDGKKRIYLDALFKLRDELNLTFEQVKNNIVTIFLTGYETTAIAMSYTCLMLAMHPEIDRKVEEEIFENYTPGDEITHELLKKFPYLEQVLKEAMRLFPPAPLTLRENMEEVEFDGIGKLPKGTFICAHMYNMQRSKDVWGDRADKFDPEHFSPEFLKTVDPHAWMPFTAGPRNCIGYAYAMVSMKIALLQILSRFKFTTKLKFEDIKLKYCVNIKMIGDESVEAHPRRPGMQKITTEL